MSKKKTADSLPASEFKKLSQRLKRLEAETAELRAVVAAQAVSNTPAALLSATPEEMAAAKAETAYRQEADFGYVISTNLGADITRLLDDRSQALVAAPVKNRTAEYEELRLYTATSIVNTMRDNFANIWAQCEPIANQPWSRMEPQQARQELLAYLREQTATQLAERDDTLVQEAVSNVFVHQPPSPRFNRLTDAPQAVEEGKELGYATILNVFDQLQADLPATGNDDAEAVSDKAIAGTRQTVLRVLKKHAAPQTGRPRTHQQLFAQCYMGVLEDTLERAFTMAGAGSEPLPDGVKPLRMAGAILSELGLAQRPIPNAVDRDDPSATGIKNGNPAETAPGVQTREILRVIEVVWDSIYNGELQHKVQESYVRRASTLFPNGARQANEWLISSGWANVRRAFKAMDNELFTEMNRQDGWTEPHKVPVERKNWTFASGFLH